MQQTKRVKNPGKQRKRLFNAPAHIRHKLMGAPLSAELAASRGTKTLSVRKGDTVRIQRGNNKGFEGKVSRVDLKAYRIYIEGLTREKVDGTNVFLAVHPSKVQIRNLNLEDKWRKDILGRKKAIETPKAKTKVKTTKKAEKPKTEVTEEKAEQEAQVTAEMPAEVPEEADEETAVPEKEEQPKATKKAATKTRAKSNASEEAEEEGGQ
jgi:large subunit ribosomal protein L24